MPPKSSSNKKKLPTSQWYHCTECQVYITHKAREDHEKYCPIKEYNGTTTNECTNRLDYIRNGILYSTTVEKRNFTIDALEDLSRKHLNNLLFISEEALKLLEWKIGQYVVIEGTGHPGAPLIRSLWPIPARFLTTILVNEEDYELYWNNFKKGESTIRIKCLSSDRVQEAKFVEFRFVPDKPFQHRFLENDKNLNAQILNDITKVLKQQLKDLCVAQGTQLYLDFFNQNLCLNVQKFDRKDSNKDITTLEKQIEAISLKEDNDFSEIVQITSDTTIHIISESELSEENEANTNGTAISNSTTFNDIGGLTKQIEKIKETLELAMGLNIQYMPKGLQLSRGLLMYGPPGCGKSMICEAITSYFSGKMIQHKQKPLLLQLNSGDVFSKFLGETEKNLLDFLTQVFRHYPEPTLIIIEDIHMLCPRQESNTNDTSKRLSTAFLRMIDSLCTHIEGSKCFILATTGHLDLLNIALRRCGRFDCEIEISVPDRTARSEILQCIFNKMISGKDYVLSQDDIEQIAQITHGFVGADLMHLVRQSYLYASKSSPNRIAISLQDLKAALVHVHPSAMREVLIECPNVRWSDIGGQSDLKLKLQQAIEWPLKHYEHFQRMGVEPTRGILLYGPPGCSKTMIAKALATESRLNFISIKGPELFSMWVGESERAVREVFRKARQVAPAIVFFDEIDAIGGERSTETSSGSAGGRKGGDSVQERVLAQLLTELDGVEPLENVTILAATNRPDLIDKALLRPGRIDRIIYVGLPDAAARKEIFQIKLTRTPIDQDVDMEKLIASTENYTGAEIQAVCQEAALRALGDDLNCMQVKNIHFQEALETIRPRIDYKLLQIYEEYSKSS